MDDSVIIESGERSNAESDNGRVGAHQIRRGISETHQLMVMHMEPHQQLSLMQTLCDEQLRDEQL